MLILVIVGVILCFLGFKAIRDGIFSCVDESHSVTLVTSQIKDPIAFWILIGFIFLSACACFSVAAIIFFQT